MSRRRISIITIACLLVSVGPFGAGGRAADKTRDNVLRIHLPREIAIDSNVPSLGQIGIIRGDESLVAKASKIALGRIAVPGQQVTIDRRVLLSRLACNGIPVSQVRLTGAEKIIVSQKGRTIKADELVKLARLFLDRNLPTRAVGARALGASSICRLDMIRGPEDVIIEGARRDIKLVPRLFRGPVGPGGIRNQAKVRIGIVAGGKEIGSREIGFRFKYNCRKVVTLVEIPTGAVIIPENVKVEKIVSNYPEPSNWRPPFGLVARRRLLPNTVLTSSMVGPVKPPIVVKRNQNVVIRIDAGGLVITAMGRTVEEGAAGDYVRVRNVDSQRVILAKVNEDGTVGPVF
ncbi:MAG: flagellar basal body P-ring formation protein FlgA [Phycisphaerae bacterium]|nr:flagellar basal body P-ring formation protein FlgA [Phycisphaerae bacterium]